MTMLKKKGNVMLHRRRHRRPEKKKKKKKKKSINVMSSTSSKSIDVSRFNLIGFDLDHTLVRYRLRELNELCFRLFRDYLLTKCNMHVDCVPPLADYDFAQCKKGLVIDMQRGNILVLSGSARVMLARHGGKLMSDEDIANAYGVERATDFAGKSTAHGWWSLATAFMGSIAQLYSFLVDWLDRNSGSVDACDNYFARDYVTLAEALYDGVTYHFAAWGRGGFFDAIAKQPERYLYARDDVKRWLVRLRERAGARLFVCTNSLPEYTDFLLRHVFGKQWSALFDLTLTYARKPLFFADDTLDFFEWRQRPGAGAGEHIDVSESASQRIDLAADKRYSGGCARGLVERLGAQLPQVGADDASPMPRVLYFGDHLESDCRVPEHLAAEHPSTWHAVAIVEELEDLASSSSPAKTTNSDHGRYWGDFFVGDDDELSYWGAQMLATSCAIADLAELASSADVSRIEAHETVAKLQSNDLAASMQRLSIE
jgi:HAD superfamily 5'-nucleotidase-like hydrolase